MDKPTSTRRAARPVLILALGGALAACGGGSGTTTTPSQAGGDGGDPVTVQAAQFSWTAAALTNQILAEIAERHPELGVAEIETTQLDPAAAWTGARRGDIDLLTEVALPNQQPFADEASERMEIVSETYGNANQGWFVPSYIVEPGGPAEGLTSVEQLDEYRDVFDGKLYDADPGYVTTEQNRARLQGYGLDFEHVVAGEAAELAQLERSYSREEPILLYLYRPHSVFAQFDMTQLEEGRPYEEGCFTEGDGACAMPAYSANIAVSDELHEQAPEFVAMLEEFQIPLEGMEEMQKAVDVDGEPVEAVATQWVEEHADQIQSWVPETA
jgi:glycine betaine/proline transport system substrate-binding protein